MLQKISGKSAACAILLLGLFGAQALWHAVDKSAAYDECSHLAAGTLMIRTDRQDYDFEHPPLLRSLFAAPLFLVHSTPPPDALIPAAAPDRPLGEWKLDPLTRYGVQLLYRNSVPADKIFLICRSVNILLGVALGALLYFIARNLYGATGALATLFLFAFCPNFIAHSSLISTDTGGVLFAMLSAFAAIRFLKRPAWPSAWICGVCLGLALTTKLTNFLLIPAFLLFCGAFALRRQNPFHAALPKIGAIVIASWMVVCAAYGFKDIFTPHRLHEQDWAEIAAGAAFRALYERTPLPDAYLKEGAFLLRHSRQGHGGFLLGRRRIAGSKLYFPFAFLVKTPALTLLLAVLLVAALAKAPRSIGAEELCWLALMAVFGFVLIAAPLNIGIRHALILYAGLYVLLGRAAGWIQALAPRAQAFALAAFLCLPAETFAAAPHYLAFFNAVSGGPSRGIDYLSDSNLDWGQDLKNLGKYLKKEGNPEVLLSYFGTGAPVYYGIHYQYLPTGWSYPESSHINSTEPAKELLAVSATNLQGTYFAVPEMFGWLKNKKPVARIGFSIYVYDVTNDLEAQENILRVYEQTGLSQYRPRQVGRIEALRKKLSS